MFQLSSHRFHQMALALVAGVGLTVPAFAAITVTHPSVKLGTENNILLSYRLNEPATSVQIQLTGGQSYPGGTQKGLNTVSLPIVAATQKATITATAPAPSGSGGAKVIVPVTLPDNRTTPASTNMIGVDVVRRTGSPYLGNIYMPTGFSQAGQKYTWVYAPDGTMLFSKNLGDVIGSGSWPFGLAVAQEDPQDRVVIHNRSAAKNYVFGPDMAYITEQAAGFLVPGMSITPNSGNAAQPWNVWQSGGKTKDVIHNTSDLSTTAGRTALTPTVGGMTMTGGENVHDIAVDPTNRVMFKVQVTDGGIGPISEGGANKWTSTDGGATWTQDTTWQTGFQTAVAADLLAAGSTLTTAQLAGGGISLAAGFNAGSPATSSVWIAVVDSNVADLVWNRIYRVNAATGAIEQTINVEELAAPEGGEPFAGKLTHFIEADHAGNLVITLQTVAAGINGQFARYFAILGPNAATNATTLSDVSLEIPPFAIITATPNRVANTGTAQVTLTATVTDVKGIAENNVAVTADLTRYGLTATETLTRGTIDGGITAPFTKTFTVPADIDLANSGAFEIAATVTGNTYTNGFVARAPLAVYNAYTPSWTVTTNGPVNSSPATSGTTAFFGDDAGYVYSIDTATGQPNANFAGGNGANVGAPVVGALVHNNGLLYVSTTQGVRILNGGNGRPVASRALANVSSLEVSPLLPGMLFVAAGNQIYKLNAFTGADMGVSVDLGAKVNRVAVVPSSAFDAGLGALVVAGTEGDTEGKNGKIIVLNPETMAGIFTDANSAVTVAPFVDAAGPVRSKATYGESTTDGKFFAIGGASGLWGINSDTGAKLAWTAGSGGGANVGGNPYTPGTPVDANPDVPTSNTAPFREDTRIAFATVGNGATGGQLYLLIKSSGERASYGGYPVPLTKPGSGFAAEAGVLGVNGATGRTLYIGSDANDRRFFAVETKPDDVSYAATAAKTHIFDPNDQATFPGTAAGAFNSTPALASDRVVVGSAASRAYGFPVFTEVPTYVKSMTPANGASGQPTSPSISVVFSADMSALFIDESMVWLQDEAGNKVSSSVNLDFDNVTVTLQPNAPLTDKKTYTVVVSPAISQPFSASFTVGTIPPPQYDVNGDGIADLEDVKEIIRMVGGLKATTDLAKSQGDLAAPIGTLTLEDAVALRKRL